MYITQKGASVTVTYPTVPLDVDFPSPVTIGNRIYRHPPQKIRCQQGGDVGIKYPDGSQDIIAMSDAETLPLQVVGLIGGGITTALGLTVFYFD